MKRPKNTPPLNLVEEALAAKWEPSVMHSVRTSQWSRRAAQHSGRDDSDVPSRPPTDLEKASSVTPNLLSDEEVKRDELAYHSNLRSSDVSGVALLVNCLPRTLISVARLNTSPGSHPLVSLSRDSLLLASSYPPGVHWPTTHSAIGAWGVRTPPHIETHEIPATGTLRWELPKSLVHETIGFAVTLSPPALSTPVGGIAHIALNAKYSMFWPFMKIKRQGKKAARNICSFILAQRVHAPTSLRFLIYPEGARSPCVMTER